jgi:hypothetical protein
MLQKKSVEEIKPRNLGSVMFFFENRSVYEKNVEKYCRAGRATDENKVQAHCMPDN